MFNRLHGEALHAQLSSIDQSYSLLAKVLLADEPPIQQTLLAVMAASCLPSTLLNAAKEDITILWTREKTSVTH